MPTGMRRQRKDVTEWMGFNHDNSSETHHSPNYAYMYVRNVWIIVGVCNSSMVETYIYIYVYIYFKFQLHTYLSKYTEIFNQESERSVAKRRSISNSVCLSVKTLHEHSVLYTVHILDSNLWPWFLQFLNTYSLYCQVYASC